MQRFGRPLIPVLDADYSLHALRETLRFLEATPGPDAPAPLALSVAPAYEGDLRAYGSTSIEAAAEAYCRKTLAKAAAVAKELGKPLRTACSIGEPCQAIVEAAVESGADVIVMGVTRRSTLGRLVHGNIPPCTAGTSPVDVLLLPPNRRIDFSKILFAEDGSLYAVQAAKKAVELATLYQSDLHIVHVVDIPPEYMAEAAVELSLLHEKGREMNRLVKTQAQAAGVRAVDHVLEGEAADALSDYAAQNGIGCIVLASHGRSGMSRLLLGSVVEDLVGRAEHPLYIIVDKPSAEAPA